MFYQNIEHSLSPVVLWSVGLASGRAAGAGRWLLRTLLGGLCLRAVAPVSSRDSMLGFPAQTLCSQERGLLVLEGGHELLPISPNLRLVQPLQAALQASRWLAAQA